MAEEGIGCQMGKSRERTRPIKGEPTHGTTTMCGHPFESRNGSANDPVQL